MDNGAVEQIIRLAEARGASTTVVLLDRTDRRVADNLDRHLRSAGRRTIVVAASAPAMRRPSALTSDAVEEDEDSFHGTDITVDHRLSEQEIARFRMYLEKNSPSTSTDLLLQLLSADPAVFSLLYRLIPDTRTNIRGVLVEEYLDLIEGLVSFHAPIQEPILWKQSK